MKLMNKKAGTGSQIMIFVYLFIFVIVFVGFYIGIAIFFGEGYDFRQVEADLLNYKVRKCYFENPDVKWSDFLKVCGLDEKQLVDHNLMFIICKEESFEICAADNAALVQVGSGFQQCFFNAAKSNDRFPKCSMSKIRSHSASSEVYMLITSSDQQPREEVA